MRKRLTALLLALVMIAALTACDPEELASKIDPSKRNWVDSDLIGAVKADDEIRLQDDFAAAVNKDWKLEKGEQYAGLFDDVAQAVMAKKKKAATDEAIPGETAKVLRDYYKLASDWQARNADGVEPLRPYLDDIASIANGEELLAFYTDLRRNPLGLGPVSVEEGSVLYSEKSDANGIMLDVPAFSLDTPDAYYALSESSLEAYEKLVSIASYLLGRLGRSEEEARGIVADCIAFEKKLAAAKGEPEMPDEIVCSRAEAAARAGSFPLEKLLDGWGFGENDVFFLDPGYAGKLAGIWGEGNLEQIRAYLTLHYVLKCEKYLDREAYDTVNELRQSWLQFPVDTGETEQMKEDALMFDGYIGSTAMVGAMNRVYVENFFDDAMIAELRDTTQQIIDAYKELFAAEEWLSEEGRQKSIEKLGAISIHIAYQDFDTVDYGKLGLKTREEGGNFLEAVFAARRFGLEHMAWLCKQPYNAAYWDPLSTMLSTTITNAMYRPDTNGIYIFAGICEAPAYAPELKTEEKLAGIFTVIGHEITHGFDKNGSQYDKEGKKNSWLPYEDQKAFNDRNDNVALYYSTLSPYPASGPYKGSQVNGEATADMGGLKVTLYLASRIPDFDYDLYFRSFARVWRTNVPLEKEKEYFAGDVHPLSFYRVNVGVQQFDEFYDTYGVQEGDGMYLAPDKRIKVW
ncbi:MAG: M13 family metallopeptidase [Oscillospiraceae bacterium]|nr:M13 family metallopeptidase [Oscillospiraceae bacterium]